MRRSVYNALLVSITVRVQCSRRFQIQYREHQLQQRSQEPVGIHRTNCGPCACVIAQETESSRSSNCSACSDACREWCSAASDLAYLSHCWSCPGRSNEKNVETNDEYAIQLLTLFQCFPLIPLPAQILYHQGQNGEEIKLLREATRATFAGPILSASSSVIKRPAEMNLPTLLWRCSLPLEDI